MMRKKKSIRSKMLGRLGLTLACLLLLDGVGYAQQLTGYVRAQGKGVAGVSVSSGPHVTRTDKKGFYSLMRDVEHGFVQISTPAGYVVAHQATVPQFYLPLREEQKGYNFELLRNSKDDTQHVFIAQADIQVANQEELAKYNEALIPDIQATLDKYAHMDRFGVDLGDMVGDDPALFPDYIDRMAALQVPFYRTIGNHDMAYWGRSAETSERHFKQHFGPTSYSFSKGKAHYIVLNNTFYIGRDYFYMGYIPEKTFKWIEADLAQVEKGTVVFVMMHIPTRLQKEKEPFAYNYSLMGGTTLNADALYGLLADYDAHILSGHTHQNNNVVHHSKLYEHNIAAASGSWWQMNLCTDGTPRGYAVFEVSGSSVSWYYKSAGHHENYQGRAYYDADQQCVVSNVWNYDPAWRVELVAQGEVLETMNAFEGKDAAVLKLCEQKSTFKYSWIDAARTKHLFRSSTLAYRSGLEVRLTDRFGRVSVLAVSPQSPE